MGSNDVCIFHLKRVYSNHLIKQIHSTCAKHPTKTQIQGWQHRENMWDGGDLWTQEIKWMAFFHRKITDYIYEK